MGGWSKVDIAFWPASETEWDQLLLGAESSCPPIECIELAVEPRRMVGCDVIDWRWNGNSPADVGDHGDRLSTDLRAAALENMAPKSALTRKACGGLSRQHSWANFYLIAEWLEAPNLNLRGVVQGRVARSDSMGEA
jgi:hypothetical protein